MRVDAPFLLASNSSFPAECSTTSILTFTVFTVTHILLVVPIFTVVLCLGYQRWRRRRHTPPAAAAGASHSDVFTYHIFVFETVMFTGSLSYCIGAYIHHSGMMKYGGNIFFSILSTKIHFQTLTCLEQYLAVVHPISYLGLKNSGGVRIRNVSILCVWLCFVCGISAAVASLMADSVFYYSSLAFALIIDSFCCISVLRILRLPGPRQEGRYRERIDPKKRRAFNTIVTILGVLLLSLGGMLVGGILIEVLKLNNTECFGATPEVWFSLPSSLVLPMLYLHRAGKLPRRKHKRESVLTN